MKTATAAVLLMKAETGATMIPPYDHADIIAGQGTAALELMEQVPDESATCWQAIGYAEAAKHLRGEIDTATMVEQIRIRTRQYAKRQRTWFRNQVEATAIEMASDPHPEISVCSVWQSVGPVWFNRLHGDESE